MMDKQDFKGLVDQAMQEPGRVAMRPAVEKEILHYDIFHALDGAGLLRDLVFQGGTSLRLCRGSNRFSEDLDFAGGKHFTATNMQDIKVCIEKHIGNRYGLSVEVKEPKHMAAEPDYEHIHVDKWQVSIETAPQQRDLPRQIIKIEIANIPAYTRELVPLRLHYAFLQGYGSVLVNTESLVEVMADKMVAFPAAKQIRYRDIWDMAWLIQQGATLDPEMVVMKLRDYKIDNYSALLLHRQENLQAIVQSAAFINQMTRFIDAGTIEKTLAQEGFLDYLVSTIGGSFHAMSQYLQGSQDGASPSAFRM